MSTTLNPNPNPNPTKEPSHPTIEWVKKNPKVSIFIIVMFIVALVYPFFDFATFKTNLVTRTDKILCLFITLPILSSLTGFYFARSKEIFKFFSQLAVWMLIAGICLAIGIGYYWIKYIYIDAEKDLIKATLFWVGLFSAFAALVLTKSQDDRLKNGAIGGLVSTSLAALFAIVNKANGEDAVTTNMQFLLFTGLGSTIGTFLGWYIHAIIAAFAHDRYQSPLPIIVLMTKGLEGIQDRIITVENEKPLNNLSILLDQSLEDLQRKTDYILKTSNGIDKQEILQQTIKSFLSNVCMVHNLLYKTNIMRASIIEFKTSNGILGYHWIMAPNRYSPFKLRPFDTTSEAYKLLVNIEKETYKHFDMKKDKPNMQDRYDEGYRFFTLFKIDSNHVLTLDWPDDVVEQNKNLIRGYFEQSIIPEFKKLISEVNDSSYPKHS